MTDNSARGRPPPLGVTRMTLGMCPAKRTRHDESDDSSVAPPTKRCPGKPRTANPTKEQIARQRVNDKCRLNNGYLTAKRADRKVITNRPFLRKLWHSLHNCGPIQHYWENVVLVLECVIFQPYTNRPALLPARWTPFGKLSSPGFLVSLSLPCLCISISFCRYIHMLAYEYSIVEKR